MKALVVDDSRAMRTILKKFLVAEGFEVVEAAHGKEAMDRLGVTGPLDLALVDWNMPEMNGFELVQAIRTNKAMAKMRVMMVTTETEVAQMSAALAAGADEYVMKPFTNDVLHDKLALLGLVA